jgi:hypothetical protein
MTSESKRLGYTPIDWLHYCFQFIPDSTKRDDLRAFIIEEQKALESTQANTLDSALSFLAKRDSKELSTTNTPQHEIVADHQAWCNTQNGCITPGTKPCIMCRKAWEAATTHLLKLIASRMVTK